MVCDERKRLKQAMDEADRDFDAARRNFSAGIGAFNLGDLELLKNRVDRAWENFTKARTTWESHIREHGCLEPTSAWPTRTH